MRRLWTEVVGVYCEEGFIVFFMEKLLRVCVGTVWRGGVGRLWSGGVSKLERMHVQTGREHEGRL